MRELQERWRKSGGKKLFNEILDRLRSGKDLQLVSGIKVIDGRVDLRGINLFNDVKRTKIRSYELIKNPIVISGICFNNIDFSYGDLRYIRFKSCTFNNVKFEGTNLTHVNVTACRFINVNFIDCNLSYSFLNKNIGADSGCFINVAFTKSNLTKSSFRFPTFDNCCFSDSILFETNFDGSRFKDCVFNGILDSVFFRGYSVYAQKSILGVFNKIDPRNYHNKMVNVDFRNSKLIGVSFTHNIDLSECLFPKSEDYILIMDIAYTFSKLKDVIDNEWDGENKRIGMTLIENLYYSPQKGTQKMDFIDRQVLLMAIKDEVFVDNFFSLIRQYNCS